MKHKTKEDFDHGVFCFVSKTKNPRNSKGLRFSLKLRVGEHSADRGKCVLVLLLFRGAICRFQGSIQAKEVNGGGALMSLSTSV